MVQQLRLQLLVVLFVTFAVTSAVPKQREFLQLIDDVKYGFRKVPERDRSQFAVALLFNDLDWKNFAYDPSVNNRGVNPVIDQDSPMSPNNADQYGNYLAARPHTFTYGGPEIHAEQQILANLDDLYNTFKRNNGQREPAAIVLYTQGLSLARGIVPDL